MVYEALKAFTKFEYAKFRTVENIYLQGVRRGSKPADMMRTLKRYGFTYRKQDMLADIRAVGSYSRIDVRDIAKKERALQYWRDVAEPYRADKGISMKQAWKDIKQWHTASFETFEEAEAMKDYAIDYGFDDTPGGEDE